MCLSWVYVYWTSCRWMDRYWHVNGHLCVCVREWETVYQLRCVLQQRKQCGLQDAGLIGGQALPQGQQEHEKVCGTPQTNKRLFQQCPVLLCSLCQCHYLEETGAGKSLLIITRITIAYRGDDNAFIHQQFAFKELWLHLWSWSSLFYKKLEYLSKIINMLQSQPRKI